MKLKFSMQLLTIGSNLLPKQFCCFQPAEKNNLVVWQEEKNGLTKKKTIFFFFLMIYSLGWDIDGVVVLLGLVWCPGKLF